MDNDVIDNYEELETVDAPEDEGDQEDTQDSSQEDNLHSEPVEDVEEREEPKHKKKLSPSSLRRAEQHRNRLHEAQERTRALEVQMAEMRHQLMEKDRILYSQAGQVLNERISKTKDIQRYAHENADSKTFVEAGDNLAQLRAEEARVKEAEYRYTQEVEAHKAQESKQRGTNPYFEEWMFANPQFDEASPDFDPQARAIADAEANKLSRLYPNMVLKREFLDRIAQTVERTMHQQRPAPEQDNYNPPERKFPMVNNSNRRPLSGSSKNSTQSTAWTPTEREIAGYYRPTIDALGNKMDQAQSMAFWKKQQSGMKRTRENMRSTDYIE